MGEVPGWLVGVTLLALAAFAAFYGTQVFEDGFPSTVGEFLDPDFLLDLLELLTFGVFSTNVGLPFLVKLGVLLGISIPWVVAIDIGPVGAALLAIVSGIAAIIELLTP